MKVSMIVPTFEEAESIEDCLRGGKGGLPETGQALYDSLVSRAKKSEGPLLEWRLDERATTEGRITVSDSD